MNKKIEDTLNKQIFNLAYEVVKDEFTNPCFQSAEVERSITVRLGVCKMGGDPCIEGILHTETGDKRIAYETLLQIPDKTLIRNDIQKFVTDCDITKAWMDKLPKNYDILSHRSDKGYERLLDLRPDTVVVLVKDGVPVEKTDFGKAVDKVFPRIKEINEKLFEQEKSETSKSEKANEKSEKDGFPSNVEDYYNDKDFPERDTTKDRDTSDIDVEPFGGAFVGGVERDDYDD